MVLRSYGGVSKTFWRDARVFGWRSLWRMASATGMLALWSTGLTCKPVVESACCFGSVGRCVPANLCCPLVSETIGLFVQQLDSEVV